MSVEAHSEHFCSASDNNPTQASMPYFGVIEEIWELDYIQFKVPVFKCKWVIGTTGVHRDQLGFTLVNLNKVGYRDGPFIMVEQAKQVFYVKDPCNSTLSAVLQGRSIGISDHNDESILDICEMPAFTTKIPSTIEENEVDDVHANRNDHDEGLWENIPT